MLIIFSYTPGMLWGPLFCQATIHYLILSQRTFSKNGGTLQIKNSEGQYNTLICLQNVGNPISEKLSFKHFSGEDALDPPTGECLCHYIHIMLAEPPQENPYSPQQW